ncbi:MAG: phosphotransferase [bacterium]|nr:phosphotransferase [bacterium]
MKLISDPHKIDPNWLTEALHQSGALPDGRVLSAPWKQIGTGKMGDNVRFELEYEGAPDSAPRSVVAKLPATDPTSRANAAGNGSYWKEVCFYRELASRLPIRTPHCHCALIDSTNTDFIILMEDMSPSEPGDQIEGCSVQTAELALREVAKLHGPLWNRDEVAQLEWVSQGIEQESMIVQIMLSQHWWPGILERFGEHMSPEQSALGERFVNSYSTWAQSYDGPRTLVHVDYRLENVLLAGDSDGVPISVVDWGSPARSGALTDVSYFLGAGLLTEQRREHERALVEAYRQELQGFGVSLSAEEAWNQYRRYALHGVLITVAGAMMSGADPRGDRMFIAMIQRHLQHALDLDSAEFLPNA